MFKYFYKTLLLFLFCYTVNAGQIIQVTKTMEVNASPKMVWSKIGDFCAIQEWHPAVAKCVTSEEDSVKFRTLTLQDGAPVKEKYGGKNPTGYMYSIIESPFPVKDYNSLFEVEANGENSVITWTATFLAKDATDTEAKEVIEGIYDAGLESIRNQIENN